MMCMPMRQHTTESVTLLFNHAAVDSSLFERGDGGWNGQRPGDLVLRKITRLVRKAKAEDSATDAQRRSARSIPCMSYPTSIIPCCFLLMSCTLLRAYFNPQRGKNNEGGKQMGKIGREKFNDHTVG